MPRKSAAARAASTWRARSRKDLTPPSWLSPEAAALFTSIIRDRPAEHFRPGTLGLLAAFCDLSVQLAADTTGTLAERLVLANKLAHLGSKLRLTPSTTIHRRSGLRDERGNTNPLLGGHTK